MTWLQFSSIFTSMALTRWSSSITRVIKATSPLISDSTALLIWFSTRPPICNTLARMASSSVSNWREMWSLLGMVVFQNKWLFSLGEKCEGWMTVAPSSQEYLRHHRLYAFRCTEQQHVGGTAGGIKTKGA